MKKLLVVLMMIFSGPTFADGPSLFENMQMCTFYASKVTEYTVYAKISADDETTYQSVVQAEMATLKDPDAKHMLASLAIVAWKNRSKLPVNVGMYVYDDCVKHTGIST